MEHPVGTGPFRLAHWTRTSRIVLERNPTYRDETWDFEPPADLPALAADAAPAARPQGAAGRPGRGDDRSRSRSRAGCRSTRARSTCSPCRSTTGRIAAPNRELAPHLARRGVRLQATPLADIVADVLQHGASGRRRLRAGEGGAAPGDQPRLRQRPLHPRDLPRQRGGGRVAGRARHLRLRPGVPHRALRVQPGPRQGAARHLRLRRPRRRRLARAAGRLAAGARDGRIDIAARAPPERAVAALAWTPSA